MKLRYLSVGTLFMAAIIFLLYEIAPGADASAKRGIGVAPVVGASATPTCQPLWFRVESPNVGEAANELRSVDGISTDDMWSVGFYLSITGTRHLRAHEPQQWQKQIEGEVDRGEDEAAALRTLVEHWDGAEWMIIPSPNVGMDDNHLLAVDALSANDAWAVGYYVNDFGIAQTLALHWDGAAWSRVVTPNSVTTQDNELLSVEAVSANDVWAVGYTIDEGGVGHTLTMRWNGAAWSIVPSPDPPEGVRGNALRDLAVVSANDIWAAGFFINEPGILRTLSLHWNGSAWSVVAMPSVGASYNIVYSVDATASNDVWAVGYYFDVHNYHLRSLAEHWDGTQWTPVAIAAVGQEDQRLLWVDMAASGDVWAVGAYGGYSYSSQALIEHWNGAEWRSVPGADFGLVTYNVLMGVKAMSADDVWAVGTNRSYNYYTGDPETLIEHYGDLLASCGKEFADLPVGNTFRNSARYLACRGVISGYACGGAGEPCDPQNNPYFRPNNIVTRGQLAKVVSNAAGFNEDPGPPIFADVYYYYTQFYPWINRLARRGIVTGYPCGTRPEEPCYAPANPPYFRPNSSASRGQIAKIVAVAGGYTGEPDTQTFQDVPAGSVFYTWVENLAAVGAIGGYACGGQGEPCVPPLDRPYFRPGNNATRGQMVKIVTGAFFPGCSLLAAKP